MRNEASARVPVREGAWILAFHGAVLALLLSMAVATSAQGPGTEGREPESMGFVDFFRQLVEDNRATYQAQRAEIYTALCMQYDLDPADGENRERFYVLAFLHELFTCRAPVDCDRAGALEIPYMWHWIEPNPRHSIRRRTSGELLKDETPPAGFRRYQSFADIDRVPSLYLADLVAAEPQYEHPRCGSMYTFGWCSEREMAFCLLAGFFGEDGWVRQSGNHVWSVFPFQWRKRDGQHKDLLLEFDNTYDIFGGQDLPPGKTFREWRQENQVTREQRWYNARVRDPQEVERVRRIQVPPEAQERIRLQVRSALRG